MNTHSTEQSTTVEDRWAEALCLPCRATAEISIQGFTVGQLLALKVNSIVSTGQEEGSEIPVLVNGQVIGWGEFEVAGQRLAVRLVELA